MYVLFTFRFWLTFLYKMQIFDNRIYVIKKLQTKLHFSTYIHIDRSVKMEIKRYLNIIFKEISLEWFLKKVHNIYVSFSYLIAIFIIGILIYKTMYINLYKESMNSEWKELIKCDFKQKTGFAP